ncbi:MAG: YbjN domain-containing protein [Micropepsaceae bacterium]
MLRKMFTLAVAGSSLLAASAVADDKPAAPAPEATTEALIEGLTPASLAGILTEAGAEEVTPSTEGNVVRFKSSGRNYFVTLGACDEASGTCALATIGRVLKAKLPIEVLNRINAKYDGLISAARVSDASFRLVHSTIISGGVTTKNLAVNLVWYVNETPEFESFIKSQLVAENPASRPDLQNVSAGLPLGDVVLTPDELKSLTDKLNFRVKQTSMKLK